MTLWIEVVNADQAPAESSIEIVSQGDGRHSHQAVMLLVFPSDREGEILDSKLSGKRHKFLTVWTRSEGLV